MRILVLYGTSEGQTRKVAGLVSDRFVQLGHQVTMIDVLQKRALDLSSFDAAIIAARVHAGVYQRQIVRFVENYRDWLMAIPNAFLSVSMSAANLKPGDLDRAKGYVDAFVERTRWRPRQVVQVAGARLYTRHNIIGRWILGLVDRNAFDTSKDHVWTDWKALDQFATDFAKTAVGV